MPVAVGVGALGVVWYLSRGTHPQVSGVVTPVTSATVAGGRVSPIASGSPATPIDPFSQWLNPSRKVAHMADSTSPVNTSTIDLYAANLDFAKPGDRHDILSILIGHHNAQGIFAEELWSPGHPFHHLSDIAPHWNVNQGNQMNAASKNAIAVAPEFPVVRKGARFGVHVPGMGSRDIKFSDVNLDGHIVELVDVHMPAERFHAFWPVMAARLAAFKASARYPVIIGGDWNARINGPLMRAYSRRLGLKRYGVGIDGFLYSPQLNAHPLPTVSNAVTKSDHPFPGARFSWKANVR